MSDSLRTDRKHCPRDKERSVLNEDDVTDCSDSPRGCEKYGLMKISYREGKPGLILILIDDMPWKEISTTIFGRQPKFPKCDTLNEFTSEFLKWEYRLAREYALRRLGAKQYLSFELGNLMRRKGVSEETIASILEECLNRGFLNDEEWIKSYVDRFSKKQGPKMIAIKLRQKGVDPAIAEEAAKNQLSPTLQKAALLHLLHQKYKKRNLADPKERQKVIASLGRRGYDFDLIFEVIGRENQM